MTYFPWKCSKQVLIKFLVICQWKYIGWLNSFWTEEQALRSKLLENAKLLKEIYVETKNEEIAGTFSEGKLRQHKTATGEEKSNINEHTVYVAEPKIKKRWQRENFCYWLPYIFRRSALSLSKSNFFLYFPRIKKLQNFGFSRFFSRVIIFAIANLKNISRVFNFTNSTKVCINRENLYPWKLVPLRCTDSLKK